MEIVAFRCAAPKYSPILNSYECLFVVPIEVTESLVKSSHIHHLERDDAEVSAAHQVFEASGNLLEWNRLLNVRCNSCLNPRSHIR